MTPFAARLTFLGLIVLAGAISWNALLMQPSGETRPTAAKRGESTETASKVQESEQKSAAKKGPLAVPPEADEAATRAETSKKPARPDRQRAKEDTHDEERRPPPSRVSQRPPEPAIVRAIQRELLHRDYRIERRDGQVDLATRIAILLYEYNSGLTLTGRPSEALLERILFGPFRGADTGDPVDRMETDTELVAQVQVMLSRLGFANLKATGRLGADTRSALREFAQFRDLRPKGRLTPRLLLELADVTGEPIVLGGLREPEQPQRN
jgi:hypothetical protein